MNMNMNMNMDKDTKKSAIIQVVNTADNYNWQYLYFERSRRFSAIASHSLRGGNIQLMAFAF